MLNDTWNNSEEDFKNQEQNEKIKEKILNDPQIRAKVLKKSRYLDGSRTHNIHLCRGEMSRTNFKSGAHFSSFCFALLILLNLRNIFFLSTSRQHHNVAVGFISSQSPEFIFQRLRAE